MTIEAHIVQLLNNNKIVIIPEFGGFKLRYIPAKLESSGHNMEPPRNEVLFDEELSYKDDTLANQLVNQENYSIEKAEQAIKSFVNDIREKIASDNRKYFIKGLGYFHQDACAKLMFVSELKASFALENFGLSSYQFKPVNPINPEKPVKSEKSVEKTNDNSTKGKKQIVREEKGIGSEILKWIVIAVAACVIGILITLTQFTNITPGLKIDFSFLEYDYDYQYLDSSEFAGVLDTMDFEGFYNDSEIDEIDDKIDTTSHIVKSIDQMTDMQNALKFEADEKPDRVNRLVIKEEKQDSVFYIIAASFATYNSAQAYKQKLIFQGFDETEIVQGNNRYRISLYSFDSKQLALDKLYSVRKIDGKQKCWLLKQKV